MLVKRCDTRHEGWRTLRDTLQDAGANIPWSRAERSARTPTIELVMADCATPGRTPLVRVQHIAAEQRARALAPYLGDVAGKQLGAPEVVLGPDEWPDALAAAVRARSRSAIAGTLRDLAAARR